jgi:cell division protein FtsW (lipid II flippase)
VATLIATFVDRNDRLRLAALDRHRQLHIQVSEFVKLVIVLLVARYLSELKGDQLELRDLLKLAGLVGLPMILVMIQPDLGTALTFVPILAIGVFLAGFVGSTQWRSW